MGIKDLFKNTNKVSAKSVKNQVLTKQEIDNLRAVKSSDERIKIIKKNPFVLPYVLNAWADDNNINNIVKTAIKLMPENVTKLGKGNIMPTSSYVNLAVETKPSVIFDLSDDLKSKITKNAFFNAFTKDPEICASNAPVLKDYVVRNIIVFRKNKMKEIKYKSTVRNECLKAIRIAMGVSTVHEGYDDFAELIAEKLEKNKVFDKYQTKDKMATQIPTVVNSLIKNQDVRIYAMPVEVWKLNNYKTLYLAVRESLKKNSKINGVLEFIPFDLLPEKVTKKVVASALKKDPKIWTELEQYNLEYLKDDTFIQYVAYASCKKHKCLDIIESELSAKEKLTAENKIAGVVKRKQTKMQKGNTKKLPAVIYTVNQPSKTDNNDMSM